MNIFQKLFSRKQKEAAPTVRSFNGSDLSRLNSDWLATGSSADAELHGNIKTLRNRCRELERNNDYVRRYFKLVQNNVLGHCGVGLQMKIKERTKKDGVWVDRYDRVANNIIEDAWEEWGKKANCTVAMNLTWKDCQKLILRSVVRDGAVLIRKHYPQDRKFKFALEPIEIDRLDVDYNTTGAGGSVTKMGIAYDINSKVVGYWLLRDHPGELYQPKSFGKWQEFVPASQIFHIYDPERIGQSTGIPWLISSMVRLKNLGAYEEAEVIASRIGAAKMGFLIPNATATGGYVGQDDGRGNKFMDVEPGSIETLPRGYDFKSFDPTHPSTAFKDFVKATLRGISAGLGVSYVSLANDLESVNYSSIRAGLLEEREEWKTCQEWLISWFITPVFEEWLSMAAVAGALNNNENGLTLPAAKLAKWNQPEWKPRRWDWVDPLKDLQASVLAVEKGFKSRRSIISEGGGDIEDTFQDINADEELADEYGLEFNESDEQANVQQETPDAPDKVAAEDQAAMKKFISDEQAATRKLQEQSEKRISAMMERVAEMKPAPAIVQPPITVNVTTPPSATKSNFVFKRDEKGNIIGGQKETEA